MWYWSDSRLIPARLTSFSESYCRPLRLARTPRSSRSPNVAGATVKSSEEGQGQAPSNATELAEDEFDVLSDTAASSAAWEDLHSVIGTNLIEKAGRDSIKALSE